MCLIGDVKRNSAILGYANCYSVVIRNSKWTIESISDPHYYVTAFMTLKFH